MSKANLTSDDLINQGYEILDCPRCNTECKPIRINKNDSVTYESHECNNGYELLPRRRSFRIAANGELIARNGF